jgi:hypothetical protein
MAVPNDSCRGSTEIGFSQTHNQEAGFYCVTSDKLPSPKKTEWSESMADNIPTLSLMPHRTSSSICLECEVDNHEFCTWYSHSPCDKFDIGSSVDWNFLKSSKVISPGAGLARLSSSMNRRI